MIQLSPSRLTRASIIIIIQVYIETEPDNPVLRRCTILVSPTQTCFHPANI